MATTFESATVSASSTNNTTYWNYGETESTDVFVITFSDGTQIAITSYTNTTNDGGLQVGIPADDTVNFWLWEPGTDATFTVYNYSGGTLGTVIHSYPGGPSWGALQFQYNAASDELSLTSDPMGEDKILLIDNTSGAYYQLVGDDAYVGSVSLIADAPICFLRGTRILTERGEVAVEELREGDLVATRFGGLTPVRWIGTQSFEGRLASPSHLPVRFLAGSLGGGLPRSDLLVSPGHAMLVGEVLVHAGALVNGQTILQEPVHGTIDYFHLDLGEHDCVLANGAWAESYFEDRNRDAFHNAGEYHARFHGHAPRRQGTCLPILVTGHPQVPALRARLAPPVEGMFLLADGRRLALERVGAHEWRAALPAGIRRLRLCSSRLRPSDLGGGDARMLGAMVYAIALAGTPIDCADAEGWHGPEQDGTRSWRWTDGDAAVPLPPGRTRGELRLNAWLPLAASSDERAAA